MSVNNHIGPNLDDGELNRILSKEVFDSTTLNLYNIYPIIILNNLLSLFMSEGIWNDETISGMSYVINFNSSIIQS